MESSLGSFRFITRLLTSTGLVLPRPASIAPTVPEAASRPWVAPRWFQVLAGCIALAISPLSFGQSMTLSAPGTASSAIDTMPVVFSISGETGTIGSVRLVMTYVSGYSTESIGSTWSMTMITNSATQSFSFNPSTAMSFALFSSVVQADASGNIVTATTNPPDGVYNIYAQYTRGATGAVVRSNTATSVSIDTGALPPTFSYAPSAFTIDSATDVLTPTATSSPVGINPTTDIFTLPNHGFAADAAVTLSGTDLNSATTYYVSLIDSSRFRLATTAGGSTYADVTAVTSGTLTSPSGTNAVAINPTTDVVTLAAHGLAANTVVNIAGTNLSSGTNYYVSVIDTNSFKLTTTSGGATFADFAARTIGSISPACHLMTAGTPVKIAGTNQSSATTFYVSPIDAASFKLATTSGGSTYADFWNGNSGVIRSVSAATAIAIDPSTDVITVAAHGLANNAPVTISGTNLSSTTTYYVSVIDSDTFKLATASGGSTYADFLPGTSGTIRTSTRVSAVTINPATDVITLASHGIAANTAITISGTNLWSGTTYYVSIVDTNSFKLATTSSGSTFADLSAGTTGSLRSTTFTTVANTVSIAPATDIVTLANHGFTNDTAITLSGTSLSASATYYVSVIDSNTFKLATAVQWSALGDFSATANSSGTLTSLTALAGDVLTLGTNLATFTYSIPENVFGSSAKITFTGRTTVVLTLPNSPRSGTLVLDRRNLGPGLLATTSTTLPDDTYTVSLTYRDFSNHNATAVTIPFMAYDAGTLAPTLTTLIDNAALVDGSTIPYTLPEAPYGGTVKLTFNNGTTTTVIPLANDRSGTFTYSRALHAAAIPTGIYTVSLSYQDTSGNEVTATTVTGVQITVAPLSATTDTDGDGLNDLAELKLAYLGFDWQVAQPALVDAFLNDSSLYTLVEFDSNRTTGRTDVTSAPNDYSLYTATQVTAQYDAGRLVGRSDVTTSPSTYSLYTATEIADSRTAGRADVTTSPNTYDLFTQSQLDAQSATSRTAGQADVTSAPNSYSLYTGAQVTAQYDAGRLVGRADVTTSPSTYSLYTATEIADSRTAGRADVTTSPNTYDLFTQSQLDAQASTSRTAGQADVTGAPATFNLFTQTQIDASRTAGRTDVTTSPNTYDLFTQAQLDAQAATSRAAGRADVTSSPATYSLYTATEIADSRTAGQADVTGAPATFNLFTQTQIDASRTAGRSDVTTSPNTYDLFTQSQLDAQAATSRTAGRADVTSSPATYSLYTATEIATSRTAGQADVTGAPATFNLFTQAQIEASRTAGQADVTTSPSAYSLYTATEIAAALTAGRADVTSAPNTFDLFTTIQVQDQVDAARLLGRADVTTDPGTYTLFTQSQLDTQVAASRTAGQADVTSAPASFNLFTQSQLDAQAASSRTAGRTDVTTSPSTYSLYTATEIADSRTAGRADVTSSPNTYTLFTQSQLDTQAATSRAAGQADVTGAPASFNLFTQSQLDAQAASSRAAGRTDVTSSPATYSLYTATEITASRTAGRTDVTSAPNTFDLFTTTQVQNQVDAARLLGRADVTTDPGTYTLFTQSQLDTQVATSRTAGQADVTGAPNTYSLFTQSQLDAQAATSRAAGRTDVTSSPATYNLVTTAAAQAQATEARNTGRNDVTGSPSSYGLFSTAQVITLMDGVRLLGRNDVLGDPTSYSLFTALQVDTQVATARAAGRTDVTSAPATYNLYRATDLQALAVGSPIITRNPSTGKWRLTVVVQKSTDLTHYAPLPFTTGAVAINADGNAELEFTVPETAAFFRLETR